MKGLAKPYMDINMDKKVIIILLAFVTLTMKAQNKLIRIDAEVIAWEKSQPQFVFFDKEKARLLMPKDIEFGVECIPSFSPEWTLTYDSLAHVLIYKEAQESIWYSTYDAMHKKKKEFNKIINEKVITFELRKEPKNYQAPNVKTYSLSISEKQVKMLKAIWTNAIGTSEESEDFILDGTTWTYFIGEQRAEARTGDTEEYSIVKLTQKLVEAVKANDASRLDSLIGEEFQNVVSSLEVVSNK